MKISVRFKLQSVATQIENARETTSIVKVLSFFLEFSLLSLLRKSIKQHNSAYYYSILFFKRKEIALKYLTQGCLALFLYVNKNSVMQTKSVESVFLALF